MIGDISQLVQGMPPGISTDLMRMTLQIMKQERNSQMKQVHVVVQ